MLTLKSNTATVAKSPELVYSEFSDYRNFEAVMPEGTQSFSADDESMTFTLKGLPEIKLKTKALKSPELISLEVAGGKIHFTLSAHISAGGANEASVYISFEGDINPMMAMMVKQPLQKFINSLAENIGKSA